MGTQGSPVLRITSVPPSVIPAGDIIISTRPVNPRERIIKRVTALQGQQVNVYQRGVVAPLVVTVSCCCVITLISWLFCGTAPCWPVMCARTHSAVKTLVDTNSVQWYCKSC